MKKLWSEYGIGAIVVLLIVAYAANVFVNYLSNKGSYGSELMTTTPNSSYKNKNANSFFSC